MINFNYLNNGEATEVSFNKTSDMIRFLAMNLRTIKDEDFLSIGDDGNDIISDTFGTDKIEGLNALAERFLIIADCMDDNDDEDEEDDDYGEEEDGEE